ncbi:hypothetical protein ACFQW6_09900 [Nocardioides sp. GCM10028917]|uniref:hypothetical protein n=1 Tax=Nocardioides sp. GCM10028917 TaxID=3273408 RepID=UPI00361299B6
MDRLAIVIERSQVAILVNHERLEELARVVELPHARAEAKPRLAGDYEPLFLDDIASDRKHFLGEPMAAWFGDGDTVLMGCGCGTWGCWPLTARVKVDASHVRWHDFRNGHRDWNLGALGPFVFDRQQYEAALVPVR